MALGARPLIDAPGSTPCLQVRVLCVCVRACVWQNTHNGTFTVFEAHNSVAFHAFPVMRFQNFPRPGMKTVTATLACQPSQMLVFPVYGQGQRSLTGPPGPGHLELRCSPDPRGPSGQTCLLWLPSVNQEGQLEQLWAPLPCWPQQGAQQARPTAP